MDAESKLFQFWVTTKEVETYVRNEPSREVLLAGACFPHCFSGFAFANAGERIRERLHNLGSVTKRSRRHSKYSGGAEYLRSARSRLCRAVACWKVLHQTTRHLQLSWHLQRNGNRPHEHRSASQSPRRNRATWGRRG